MCQVILDFMQVYDIEVAEMRLADVEREGGRRKRGRKFTILKDIDKFWLQHQGDRSPT